MGFFLPKASYYFCLSNDPIFPWGSVASSSLKLNMQLLICWCYVRLAAYLMWTCPKLEWKTYLRDGSQALLWNSLSWIANVRPNEAKTQKALWVRPRDILLDFCISMTFLSGKCMHENTFCVRIKEERFEKPNDRLHASDESFWWDLIPDQQG